MLSRRNQELRSIPNLGALATLWANFIVDGQRVLSVNSAS
jgi:hypothetical protein